MTLTSGNGLLKVRGNQTPKKESVSSIAIEWGRFEGSPELSFG